VAEQAGKEKLSILFYLVGIKIIEVRA